MTKFLPGEYAYALRILPPGRTYEPDTSAESELEAYRRYGRKERVSTVGRKIVRTDYCRRYVVPETDPEIGYLVEKTVYSPEYLLFPTYEAAAEFIIRRAAVQNIRDLANKLSPDHTDMTRLKNIETALLAATRKQP